AYAGACWLLGLLTVAVARRGPDRRPLPAVAVTLFGALYGGGTLAFLIAVRHGGGDGRPAAPSFLLALLPLVLTWICDTAAYAVGSTLRGPRLAPVLSPGKTWSGAVGGLAAAVLFAVPLGLVVLNRAGWALEVWQLVGLGLVVGIVAQVGDLAESLLKREAGVKDSSALLPGHGGVLDRLDSLYFVIPASALLYALFGLI
ncbi:MAG: phosphatidate cytidylyltransferase, partial [Gemmatimonadales bacterium]